MTYLSQCERQNDCQRKEERCRARPHFRCKLFGAVLLHKGSLGYFSEREFILSSLSLQIHAVTYSRFCFFYSFPMLYLRQCHSSFFAFVIVILFPFAFHSHLPFYSFRHLVNYRATLPNESRSSTASGSGTYPLTIPLFLIVSTFFLSPFLFDLDTSPLCLSFPQGLIHSFPFSLFPC